MNKKQDIAIVGAGAAGLFLARLLSENRDFNIVIFERSAQIASKLRASGGGKANIFNRVIAPECYNNPDFIRSFLTNNSPEKLERTFAHFGLVTVSDSEGRVYPATQFSSTVVNILTEFPNENVKIETGFSVKKIQRHEEKWKIDDYPTRFDIVALATGSAANLKPEQQKNYNNYITSLKLKSYEPKPSLAGFVLKNYPKSLSGCRTKAIASLFQGTTLIHKEKGEIIFKDDGISGIVIMNLSAYFRRLKSAKNCKLVLNLTHWDEHFDVKKHLKQYKSLTGIVHPKLLSLHEKKKFDIQAMEFEIIDTYPTEFAQVCCGGIDISEINTDFSAKKHKNLYVLGELLNIDGICGGYNLFFAFSSALTAAESIAKKTKKH